MNYFVKLTEIYYSGEALGSDQPQAFTCPFCGKMGFTENTLQEHVTAEHADSSIEVVSRNRFRVLLCMMYIQFILSRAES